MLTLNYSTFVEYGGSKVKIRNFEDYPFTFGKEEKRILKYASIQT